MATPGAPPTAFIAYLSTETNTFVASPTDLAAFRETALYRATGSADDPGEGGVMLRKFRSLAHGAGWPVRESLCAGAEPGGKLPKATYEQLRGMILDDLADALPVGMVLLGLHGAMMAHGYDDCEGDLLSHIRAIVGGDGVIGAILDPHCHLTDTMVTAATALVIMKEYPHTDNIERADDLFAICLAAATRKIRPVSAVFDCRMIGFYPTTAEPMAGLVRRMVAAEVHPAILSVSFAHGFPWGDNPEAGSKVLVIADRDIDLARQVAADIGRAIYAERAAFIPDLPDMAAALDRARTSPGLTLLADLGDNPGGGAPGDNVSLLRAMIDRGCAPAVFGGVYDPAAVARCFAAGCGAELDLSIGGQREQASGTPFELRARVEALKERHDQPFQEALINLGACAWISTGGIDVLLISLRSQIYAPEAFTGMGIALPERGVVAVKSTEHFRAAFAGIAQTIIAVATPGALPMDLSAIPYRHKRDTGYYPKLEDPLRQDARL
jgi:microcystin degradation protein MlrC